MLSVYVVLVTRELLSKEWKNLFWDFIEVWIQNEEDHTDSYTARDCLKKILRRADSLLSDSLAPLFQFSLYLRSASPRVVLYRQLAEDSLSSYPDTEEISPSDYDPGIGAKIDNAESRKLDSLLVGKNPESPHGKCCWVDNGSSLFFDVAELMLWLDNPFKK